MTIDNKKPHGTQPPILLARLWACYWLLDILQGRGSVDTTKNKSLKEAMRRLSISTLPSSLDYQDVQFARLLVHMGLRHYFLYIPWIRGFFKKPLKKNRQILELLLLFVAIEYHVLGKNEAIIASNAKKIVQKLSFGMLDRFIQAITKKITATKPPQKIDYADLIKHNLLTPYLKKVQQEFGSDAVRYLINSIQKEPEIDIWHADAHHKQLDDFILQTTTQQLAKHHHRLDTNSIQQLMTLYHKKSFKELLSGEESPLSHYFIGDLAASIPLLLSKTNIENNIILDLCAAPGGKTFQALSMGAKNVISIDKNGKRLAKMQENIDRLHAHNKIKLHQKDVLETNKKTHMELYSHLSGKDKAQDEIPHGNIIDATTTLGTYPFVILDAPCTASGTARKNPDLLWHKDPDDAEDIHIVQQQLLHHAAQFVEPGGYLLYIVCSFFKKEGMEIMKNLPDGFEIDPFQIKSDSPTGDWQEIANRFITKDGLFWVKPDASYIPPSIDGFFAVKLRHKDMSTK